MFREKLGIDRLLYYRCSDENTERMSWSVYCHALNAVRNIYNYHLRLTLSDNRINTRVQIYIYTNVLMRIIFYFNEPLAVFIRSVYQSSIVCVYVLTLLFQHCCFPWWHGSMGGAFFFFFVIIVVECLHCFGFKSFYQSIQNHVDHTWSNHRTRNSCWAIVIVAQDNSTKLMWKH